MAYTETDLDKIKKVIASGSLLVDYGDRKVRYRNISDLYSIRDLMIAEIAQTAGKANPCIKTCKVYVDNGL
jgi:hypothetical protein